jgi:kinetochore protein Spc7/SPC105
MEVWTSMGQIYSQLAFLAAQWPLSLNLASIQGMTAVIQLLFRTVKAKVSVSFHFDHDVLVQWPMAMRRMRFEVCPVYGDIE